MTPRRTPSIKLWLSILLCSRPAATWCLFTCRRARKHARRETAEQLVREAPNDPGVHFQRGVIARLDGEYEKALRCFDRMRRLSPAERLVASYNRARIFTYQGLYDEAIAELDQGADLEPDHPLIKTFRARALYYHDEAVKGRRDPGTSFGATTSARRHPSHLCNFSQRARLQRRSASAIDRRS